MKESNTKLFCELIKKRTKDHQEVVTRCSDIPSVMLATIRQELDSLIRVAYLLQVSDSDVRQELMVATLNNVQWQEITSKGKCKRITDREMVELSDKLIGWTKSVYKFGCAFVHLSNFHNSDEQHPFRQLKEQEREDVLAHMRRYHGGPYSDDPSLLELKEYLPSVFKKVSGNLSCYLEDLEEGRIITPASI